MCQSLCFNVPTTIPKRVKVSSRHSVNDGQSWQQLCLVERSPIPPAMHHPPALFYFWMGAPSNSAFRLKLGLGWRSGQSRIQLSLWSPFRSPLRLGGWNGKTGSSRGGVDDEDEYWV
jgi:hypothetical protein